MNCKPGDLAVVVSSYRPKGGRWIGKIVRCVRWFYDIDGEPRWQLDPKDFPAGMDATCDDKHLRPIRDNDGEDEMLRIAGKPQPVEV